MTRQEYLDAEDKQSAHRQYYGQFVTDDVKQTVARCIGVADIKTSNDPHFNDIPLRRWDALAPLIQRKGWALCEVVCTAKEAARQIKEGA